MNELQNQVTIGDKKVAAGEPSYIIAELSGNHGGSLDKALELLRAGAATGADAIKLQVYRPDTITLNVNHGDFAIPSDNAWAKYQNLYNLYEYAHTPWEWLPALFEEAQKLGIELFGSVFDDTSVDVLEQFPVKAYKIASPEIVDFGLLKKVAATGKPVIVSTGLASLTDISQAIDCLQENGCQQVILLKCTTAYPTPAEEVNLTTIQSLAQTFACPVGLSDHTVGIGVPIAAVTMGACVIEKHIKLDDGEETVDSFFSLTIEEFQTMITEIRRAEAAIGKVEYSLTPEAAKNSNGRRSLYISQDLQAGDVLSMENVRSVRPGFGLAPKYLPLILGRKIKTNVVAGDRLSWDIIE
ncbi:pseudaminic acid synthase [Shewanella sp. WXL01]|uniref:Pseudaminic acid synthase n=1 Tax=Shewanella maritima TaxID=2520507 RepID=A0A411PKG4_9GAMM|nr:MULTISPECIES: pseudaminic acid synthase [Shewanella]NKF51052.1 pseudaminic acid synthase [Shewanella sp. WXL01]QBF84009.1 pseudaminic acid synthase [Shewanella maritima]